MLYKMRGVVGKAIQAQELDGEPSHLIPQSQYIAELFGIVAIGEALEVVPMLKNAYGQSPSAPSRCQYIVHKMRGYSFYEFFTLSVEDALECQKEPTVVVLIGIAR
ncbi:hypothetical protein FGO68_gene257 [Halteria grandinella]|uniref:Uncharacterized protein n=1 Tax=Halteria grandinella TaxID=5974 RepID=A0A8J8NF18_HALGN|nr:hypothetical protein FGO68_gene257 [Halteria grandinella]